MLHKSDQEQLLLMKHHLTAYESKKGTLEALLALIASLEAALNTLKGVDVDWVESFRTEWWELEYTAALMVDSEESELTEEDEEVVALAVKNMELMLESLLKN